LTAVVLNWRMKSGSWPTAEESEACSEPIVPSIPFRFATREEISGDLASRVEVSPAASTTRPSRLAWSELSSPKTRREVERKGFR
jgi:hypothetical protein